MSLRELVKFVLGVVGMLFAVVGTLVLFFWAKDVYSDRKHTITVNAPTPIFMGEGGEDCADKAKLTVVQAGASLKVRRINYWKNCATIDVRLPDGQTGTVVLGVGDISVNPPLP